VSHDVAAKRRATRWWGVDIGDPEVVLWGSPIELGAQDWVRRIRDGLLRTTLLSAFEMSEKNVERFIRTIQRQRPRMLFGYPSAISLLAEYARNKHIDLSECGVRVCFVTAEMLYQEQRSLIENAFACKVANGYGGRDAGFIAHECPEGGMHVTAEDVIVEIIDDGGCPLPPGVAGEIVVTHMASRGFPFIRYRTGDVGVMHDQPCACGRRLPTVREIQGRATDFVVGADGTVLHGLALIYVLRELQGISSFKIVQNSLQETEVFLVVGPDYAHSAEAHIRAGFKQRLGGSVEIVLTYVNHIAPEQSGKFRYVVSKVAAR